MGYPKACEEDILATFTSRYLTTGQQVSSFFRLDKLIQNLVFLVNLDV